MSRQDSSISKDYYKELFRSGEHFRASSEERINAIESIRNAISGSARSGHWGLTILVYAADSFVAGTRSLVDEAVGFAERGGRRPSGSGSRLDEEELDAWIAWLMKGALRYVFIASRAGDPKWRYLLGSSRKPAFASRASFRVVTQGEVESAARAMMALGVEEQVFEQQPASEKYLLVNVVDCKVEGDRCASDILDDALRQLGLRLVRKVVLGRCKR